MSPHQKINYLEFTCRDLPKTKAFFAATLGWVFEDYGPDYVAFSEAGIPGGFFQSDLTSKTANGGALVVLFREDWEAMFDKIVRGGGLIVQEIFSFSGGRRFYFTEPRSNELAVWLDRTA
jgi:predicted enzyme related to lactoylglutathione lyase